MFSYSYSQSQQLVYIISYNKSRLIYALFGKQWPLKSRFICQRYKNDSQFDNKSCVIQLLQPHCALVTNFEQCLPQHVITCHQMVYSPPYKGYFISVKLLNSLKRFITEAGYTFPSLPKMVFKLHRETTQPFNQSLQTIFQFLENWGLKENQHSAIRFFLSNEGRIIIGDEWLMGKTLTALAIIELKNYRRIVVLTPKVLLTHWVFQIKQLLKKSSKVSKSLTRTDKIQIRNNEGCLELITEQRNFLIISHQYLIDMRNMSSLQEQLLTYIKTAEYLILDQPENLLQQINDKNEDKSQIEEIIERNTKDGQTAVIVNNNQQREGKQKGMSQKSIKNKQQSPLLDALRKPKNLVILSNRAEQLLIDLIPLLNTKVTRFDMQQRYQNHPQHFIQLKKIAYEYYLVKTARKCMKPPGYVKKIIMPDCQKTQRDASTKNSTEKQASLKYIMQQINRIQFISSYVHFLGYSKKVTNLMLIYQSEQFANELAICLNNEMDNIDLTLDILFKQFPMHHSQRNNNEITEINEIKRNKQQKHQLKIIICHYSRICDYRQLLDQQSRVLFCQLLPKGVENRFITKNCTDKLFMKCYQLQYFVQFTELQKKPKQFEYPDIEFDPTINEDIQCKYQKLSQILSTPKQNCMRIIDKGTCKKQRKAKYVYYDSQKQDNCIYIQQEESSHQEQQLQVDRKMQLEWNQDRVTKRIQGEVSNNIEEEVAEQLGYQKSISMSINGLNQFTVEQNCHLDQNNLQFQHISKGQAQVYQDIINNQIGPLNTTLPQQLNTHLMTNQHHKNNLRNINQFANLDSFKEKRDLQQSQQNTTELTVTWEYYSISLELIGIIENISTESRKNINFNQIRSIFSQKSLKRQLISILNLIIVSFCQYFKCYKYICVNIILGIFKKQKSLFSKMFNDLLSQFNLIVNQANSAKSELQSTLKQSKAHMGIHDPQYNLIRHGSFPKAERFRQLQKEQLTINEVQTDIAVEISSKNEVKTYSFKKGQRFQQAKKQQPQTNIEPNYNYVKRNNSIAPVIKKSALNELEKSRVSQATAASLNDQVGPGKYFYSDDKKAKNIPFSKGKRFETKKPINQDIPLYPKDSLIKKRPPSAAVLKKKNPKTKQKISIDQQEQMRERLKIVYWKSIPLEIDRLFKNKRGPVMKQKYFDIKKLTGTEKRCAILKFLDEMNRVRGGFDLNIRQKIEEKPCGVVYRKSTPKPFKFSQIQPGPDFYYPEDDLIKPRAVGFTFAKAEQKEKAEQDHRDYQINQQYLKKGGNIVINPQHKTHKLTQEQICYLNRGPGFYDAIFSQVEKRTDIGVVKFIQITDKNARQNNLGQKREVNDGIYYPSYSTQDPNVGVPLYKQDCNIQPAHVPDKVLFPEHWLFYDGDLNKVRAQIAKNVILAKNMSYKQYQKYTNKFKAFQRYLKDRDNQPEVGQYDVKFTQIDPHLANYELKRQPERAINCEGITKQQGEVNGDNLLLKPTIPESHKPTIDFAKMVGRQETKQLGQDEARDGDRLLIDPRKPEKKLPDIKFEKMVGRPEPDNNLDDQAPQGDRVKIDLKYPQKHIANIDFSKQVQRKPLNEEFDEERVELLIDPTNEQKKLNRERTLDKKIKGLVDMQRMSSVRLVPLLRKITGKQNSNGKEQRDDE